ncbi:MAG: PmbA/TldA family metallopeptidase, partial [Candidatus Hodarchaeota archaeon]
MDGKDLADYAIDFGSKHCSYIEARFETSVGNQFVLKNGNPELGGFGRSAGIGIRVLAGGGLG